MRDPWSATISTIKGDHVPEYINDHQFAGLAKGHVFDPDSYSSESQNVRATSCGWSASFGAPGRRS